MSFLKLVLFFATISYSSTHSVGVGPKVVIIGAGPAGLSAAVKLLENGIDVTVLEAESRVGGRIRTVRFGDGNVDLGAHGVHGEKGNVVFEMANALDLLERPDNIFEVLSSNNQQVEGSVYSEANEIYDAIDDDMHDNTDENISTGEYFTKKYNEAVLKKFPNDISKQTKALSLIKLFKHIMMSVDGTNDWNDSSARNSYKECEGHEFLRWKGKGFKIFLDVLMKKYPNKTENFDIESKIQTGKVVEKIIWDEEKVSIRCEGGDEVKADYVIFTPSLGVLKAKHQDLFSPGLPEKKVEAIESTGYGSIGLVSAHFPVAWWPKDPHYFLLWVDEDEGVKVGNGDVEGDKEWIKDIVAVVSLDGIPNVLELWISGKNIARFENTDELVLIDAIDSAMKKFFDNTTNIVKADKIARSDWLTNPHFRGSYSYETLESRKMNNPSSVDSLIEPLYKDGRAVVMFAGEATHPHYYSTVHGAVETGWREAKRVLEAINKKK